MKLQVLVHTSAAERPRSATLVCQPRVPGVQTVPCIGYSSVEPVEVTDLGGWYFPFVVRAESDLYQACPAGNALLVVEAADGSFTTWVANLAPEGGSPVVEIWLPGEGA